MQFNLQIQLEYGGIKSATNPNQANSTQPDGNSQASAPSNALALPGILFFPF